MKQILLFIISLCFWSVSVCWGQMTFTSGAGLTQTQDFTIGTSATATLPTGFRVSNAILFSGGTTATTQAAGTTGTGVLTGASAGGTYNFANGITASSTDRALGFLTSGGFASPRSIMLQMLNSTGSTITQLQVTFNYEKYRSGSRAFDWTFFHGTDGSTWSANTSGDQSYAADANNTVISNPPTQISKTVTITGINIADGANYYLRWTFTGVGGSSNGQGIGIDDLSVVATLVSANTTTAGTVSSPPFTLATCSATATGSVSFTSTGTFTSGNVFTAQLSDAGGSFSSPIDIGTLSGPSAEGNDPNSNISITIPSGTGSGIGYKIRISSSTPSSSTTNASSGFTITQAGSCSSIATDFFRSKATGNWNATTTWESSSDNTNWINATLVPDNNANTISILSGHTVTITSAVTIDQVVIASGGAISYTSNLITLNDGTGDDLIIYGTFDHNGGTNISINTGATVLVKTDGVVKVTSNTGGTSGAYAGNTSTAFTYETNAVFNWNSTNSFLTDNQTFFPNATTQIPIFRTSQNTANVGATNPTIFNGIFEANTPITFTAAGTKTFRNGIRGSSSVTQNNATTGAFIINGDNAVLGGNLVLNTNGLQINHAGTTTLSSNVTITGGTITLTSGDIDLNGFNIDLVTTGSIVENLASNHIIKDNTATTEANPGGYVRATGRSSATDIAGLGLSLSNASGVTIDRYHYRGASTGIKRIYRITGSPTATTLRINYAEDELAGITESDLGMFRWQSGTGWFNYTTGANKNTTANFVEVTGVNAFSHWTLGSELTPLPVRLISFKVDINKEGNSFLTWTTASEENNTGFEIQKSANGVDFNAIGFADGKGNSNQLHNYTFEDKQFNASSYYRLKQIDTDGKFSMSNLVYLQKETSKFSVYPNPIDDKALYFNLIDENIETKLINAQGKTLWQYKGSVSDTEKALHQFIQQSPQGMYLVQISTGKGILQTKIVR